MISTLLTIWFVHVVYTYHRYLLILDTQERYGSQPSPELSVMQAAGATISGLDENLQAIDRAILRVPTDDPPVTYPSASTLVVSNHFTLPWRC